MNEYLSPHQIHLYMYMYVVYYWTVIVDLILLSVCLDTLAFTYIAMLCTSCHVHQQCTCVVYTFLHNLCIHDCTILHGCLQ